MTIDEFINKTVKTGVDYDGAYGAQCVDLFRQYAKDVLEIPKHTGAVEGAKDLWLNYQNLQKEMNYFERIRANCNPKQGDVAVWDGTPGNKYGHVAIVICAWGKETSWFMNRTEPRNQVTKVTAHALSCAANTACLDIYGGSNEQKGTYTGRKETEGP